MHTVFEFDRAKSDSNRAKHGIDFVSIQALWDDPQLLEIPGRVSDEARHIVIGRIGAQYWSCVVPYRDGRVRVISARRARPKEIRLYEGK